MRLINKLKCWVIGCDLPINKNIKPMCPEDTDTFQWLEIDGLRYRFDPYPFGKCKRCGG